MQQKKLNGVHEGSLFFFYGYPSLSGPSYQITGKTCFRLPRLEKSIAALQSVLNMKCPVSIIKSRRFSYCCCPWLNHGKL